MKILYNFNFPFINDNEGFSFQDNSGSSRRLKCIDYLIDMQVNVCKILLSLVLSDDGRVFYLESEPFFDHDNQSVTLN